MLGLFYVAWAISHCSPEALQQIGGGFNFQEFEAFRSRHEAAEMRATALMRQWNEAADHRNWEEATATAVLIASSQDTGYNSKPLFWSRLVVGNLPAAKAALEDAFWPEQPVVGTWNREQRDLAIYLYLAQEAGDEAGVARAVEESLIVRSKQAIDILVKDGLVSPASLADPKHMAALTLCLGAKNSRDTELLDVVWATRLLEKALAIAPDMPYAWLSAAGDNIGLSKFNPCVRSDAFRVISGAPEAVLKTSEFQMAKQDVERLVETTEAFPWQLPAHSTSRLLLLELRHLHGWKLEHNLHGVRDKDADRLAMAHLLAPGPTLPETEPVMKALEARVASEGISRTPLYNAVLGVGWMQIGRLEQALPYLEAAVSGGGTGLEYVDLKLSELVQICRSNIR